MGIRIKKNLNLKLCKLLQTGCAKQISCGFEDDSRELAVVTSTTPWHEPPRARHQVTRQLCRFYNVLYVDRSGSLETRALVKKKYEKINDKLIIYYPRQIPHRLNRFYNYVSTCHEVIDRISVKHIEQAIHELGYNQAILINFQYGFGEIYNSKLFYPKVYFCNDDHPAQARYNWQRALSRRYENIVIRRSDCCFGVHIPLLNKLKSMNENSHLLLLAHEFTEELNNPVGTTKLCHEGKIAVCFMGYLDDRLLLDWLVSVARDERFVLYLIGPVKSSKIQSALLSYQNVKWIQPMEGLALQSMMQKMDVFINPLDANLKIVKVITATNKLFQYLACGKPIVISNMPNFISLPNKFVYKANDAKDFVDCILLAYAEDSAELMTQRIEYARANSWNARGDQLYSILKSIIKHDF
jgi:glycosyltransferase involved in cell wall biosynthesis